MEAMHATDLMFFRRASPSPVPLIVPPTDKEIDAQVDMVVETVEKNVEEINQLRVSANEERRRGILDVMV